MKCVNCGEPIHLYYDDPPDREIWVHVESGDTFCNWQLVDLMTAPPGLFYVAEARQVIL